MTIQGLSSQKNKLTKQVMGDSAQVDSGGTTIGAPIFWQLGGGGREEAQTEGNLALPHCKVGRDSSR